MVRVKLVGGLGNQLFQYAAARALANKKSTSLVIDVSEFESYDVHPFRLDRFNCFGSFVKKEPLLDKLVKKKYLRRALSTLGLLKGYFFESSLRFNSNLFDYSNNSVLFGYFQSEQYFLDIRRELLDDLSLVSPLSEPQALLSQHISSANSVAVHIRRGDYLSNPEASKVHGVCGDAYFDKAIEMLEQKKIIGPDSTLFIFSDDIGWCRENLQFKYTTTFVDGCEESPEVDMYLMSLCNHQIISNSTFSWWGAWLNDYEGKVVVAPKEWFKSSLHDDTDIVPDTWLRV